MEIHNLEMETSESHGTFKIPSELQPSASTLRNLQPTEKLQKSPLEALTESKTQFLEQDPNADDYDKYYLPLGREDTNEEIIEEGTENTSSIESTRLKY